MRPRLDKPDHLAVVSRASARAFLPCLVIIVIALVSCSASKDSGTSIDNDVATPELASDGDELSPTNANSSLSTYEDEPVDPDVVYAVDDVPPWSGRIVRCGSCICLDSNPGLYTMLWPQDAKFDAAANTVEFAGEDFILDSQIQIYGSVVFPNSEDMTGEAEQLRQSVAAGEGPQYSPVQTPGDDCPQGRFLVSPSLFQAQNR